VHAAPGDPVEAIAGASGGMSPELMAELRANYGLDKPLPVQLGIYLGKVARADLGYSYFFNLPVVAMIEERVPATLLLVLSAVITAFVIGTALGVLAARKPNGVLSQFITVLSLVGFFTLLSLSTGALTNYSAVALVSMYGVTLSAANAALTAFLFATAIGVLAGGFIADATKRHGDVAAGGFAAAALLILAVGMFDLGPVLIAVAMGAAGFLSGMIAPSRDMLVRAASPPGAFGRVFGIVTTGFNIGGTIGPLLGGWIMDHGMPRWVFFASVLFMALTAVMGLASEMRSRRRSALMAAAE